MYTYSLFLHIFYDLLELHAFLAWDYSDILFMSFFSVMIVMSQVYAYIIYVVIFTGNSKKYH